MVSKVLGFEREIVLGYFYGTSVYSDVYITAINNANRLSGFALGLFIAALGARIYPILSELPTN